MRPEQIVWRLLHLVASLLMSLALVAGNAGCSLIQGAADIPGHAVRAVSQGPNTVPVDPAEVQANLLRFADEFDSGISSGIGNLRRGTNALNRAEILRWKIAFCNKTTSIVSGPHAVANLLDMAVFVTITRVALEEHWQPEVFVESARAMLECCRSSETNIWRLVAQVITPEQQTELRAAIAAWCRKNTMTESLLAASVDDFVTPVAAANKSNTVRSGSVFDLLKLDPFSGLDPATREIAQTRLLAQRAFYLTQKMPQLLRWQMELLSLNTVEMPAVHQLVLNSTQLTTSADRLARVAEKLPAQVSAERAEIFKTLQTQEQELTPLVEQMRETLVAGSQMSTSLNTTLITFDAVMKRFGIGEIGTVEVASTNRASFRITDYTKTAAQLEATARQLSELLRTFDQTLGSTNFTQLAVRIRPAIQQAQTGGRELVDYAFWKGVLFVAVVFVAALLYRLIAARMMRGGH